MKNTITIKIHTSETNVNEMACEVTFHPDSKFTGAQFLMIFHMVTVELGLAINDNMNNERFDISE